MIISASSSIIDPNNDILRIVNTGYREGGVHGIAGGGQGAGLGEGAVVFEVFFAAAGEGGVLGC